MSMTDKDFKKYAKMLGVDISPEDIAHMQNMDKIHDLLTDKFQDLIGDMGEYIERGTEGAKEYATVVELRCARIATEVYQLFRKLTPPTESSAAGGGKERIRAVAHLVAEAVNEGIDVGQETAKIKTKLGQVPDEDADELADRCAKASIRVARKIHQLYTED